MTPNRLKAAAIGGGAAGIASHLASMIPFAGTCVSCAVVVGGGLLAMYLATQSEPVTSRPRYGEGAMIGALAGVVAGILSAILSRVFGESLTEELRAALSDAEGVPPEMLEALSGDGARVIVLLLYLVGFFFSVVLSSIGGVIGAAVFYGRRTS